MDFVVLRLIHVVGGAFWLGAAATLFLFLQPTALAPLRKASVPCYTLRIATAGSEPLGRRLDLHLKVAAALLGGESEPPDAWCVHEMPVLDHRLGLEGA